MSWMTVLQITVSDVRCTPQRESSVSNILHLCIVILMEGVDGV